MQAYPPDHWHVAEVGYKQVGDPTIYLVDANGKAKHLQADYDGPAKLAEALRNADPSFDPAKVPDLRKPAEILAPSRAANTRHISVLPGEL